MLSPVEQFYADLAIEEAEKALSTKGKRGRKATNMYFTTTTEKAIIAYNLETDQLKRNRVYKEHIDYAFNKLVENIYHTFKFTYIDLPYEDIKCEVVAFLTEKIHKYTQGKGKAYSYFSRIVKNYLIIQNNSSYAKLKRRVETTVIDDDRDLTLELSISSYQEGLKDFVNQWVDWYDTNMENIFTNKRDILIADTILEIFRIRENIENFNKKSIYILIRERTGLKTQNITRVLNTMRKDFDKMYMSYQKSGRMLQ
jgi:hypothetical protein